MIHFLLAKLETVQTVDSLSKIFLEVYLINFPAPGRMSGWGLINFVRDYPGKQELQE